MSKPVTARQLVLIIWLPIVLIAAVWGLITLARDREKAAADRNTETERALADTQRASRRSQARIDQLRRDEGTR